MTGRALEWCDNCGERETPTVGIRHYDQRPDFEEELDASFDRVCRVPNPIYASGVGGEHWRRQSNAYVGDHPWRQKKRSVA